MRGSGAAARPLGSCAYLVVYVYSLACCEVKPRRNRPFQRNKIPIMDKILTVKDVAELLQVQPITVREMFREKRLRGFKIGKAWRTTKKMFEEDVAALTSGRSPAELPQPKSPPLAVDKPGPKPAAESMQAPPAPAKAAKPKKDSVPPKDGGKAEDDETQERLF